MAGDKKITDLDRATPLGSFDFVSATGSDNYKVSYSNLAEYSSIGVQSGTFTESLTISGVAVSTGTSSPPSTEGLIKWTGAPTSATAAGVTGSVAYDSEYFYLYSVPTLALSGDIMEMAAGDGFLLVKVSDGSAFDGDIYGCGRNDFGQLGLGHTNSPVTSLTYITGDVRYFSAGTDHSVFSTWTYPFYASYSCGRNQDGQLGVGDNIDRSSPTIIYLAGTTIPLAGGMIKAGYNQTFAAGLCIGSPCAQRIYSWGNNLRGQLGTGNSTVGGNEPNTNVPTEMDLATPNNVIGPAVGTDTVNDISVGYLSTLVKFTSGSYNIFGCGEGIALGLAIAKTGSLTGITGNVRQMSVSNAYSLFTTSGDEAYTAGSATLSNLPGNSTPQYLTGNVGSSWAAADLNGPSWFIGLDGEVTGCGNNDFSQIGVDVNTYGTPLGLTGITGGGFAVTSTLDLWRNPPIDTVDSSTYFYNSGEKTIYFWGKNQGGFGVPASPSPFTRPTYMPDPTGSGSWARASLSTW